MKRFKYIGMGLSLVLVLTQLSCQSELAPEDVEQNVFFKRYGGQSSEYNFVALPTSDKGFVLVGGSEDDSKHTRFNLLDEKGTELRNVLEATTDDCYIGQNYVQLLNGNYFLHGLVSTDNYVLSPKGELINKNEWDENRFRNIIYSKPIEHDGELFVSHSNGYGAGNSNNWVSTLDMDNGEELNRYDVGNQYWGHKLLSFYLYKVEVIDGYYQWYFTGDGFANSSWSWSDPAKTYFGRLNSDGTTDIIFIDPNSTQNKHVIDFKLNSDNSVTTLNSEGFWFFTGKESGFNTYEVMNVSKERVVNWSKKYSIENSVRCNPTSIEKTADGGYLVVGYCQPTEKNYLSGFAAKLSSTGEMQWTKVYDFGDESLLYHGAELPDGRLYFTGQISGFGKGKENSDHMLLMTNRNGDYR